MANNVLRNIDGLCELHVHLDGSIRPKTFIELYNREEKVDGNQFTTVDDVTKKLAFQVGWDLPQCLKSFATTLKVLQTKESIERVTFELCEDLHLHSKVTYQLLFCQ